MDDLLITRCARMRVGLEKQEKREEEIKSSPLSQHTVGNFFRNSATATASPTATTAASILHVKL